MTTRPAPFMTEPEAREEICRVGRALFDRGYVHATAGNISVQLADGYLITPTDACLGHLKPQSLARLDAKGQQVSGARASKTIALHRRIYDASAATPTPARAIIHTHSTHLVACSLYASANPSSYSTSNPTANPPAPDQHELLAPITPYFVMKVGRVPHIAYHRPGAPEAADEVATTITRYAAAGQPIRAVMLARLGPNVWHDTPATAMAVLEELEETARLHVLARQAGVPVTTPTDAPTDALTHVLTDAQIDELRRSFHAYW